MSVDPDPTPLARFRAVPGDFAPRDAQDLMAWPFFSLAKSRRTAPIDFQASGVGSGSTDTGHAQRTG